MLFSTGINLRPVCTDHIDEHYLQFVHIALQSSTDKEAFCPVTIDSSVSKQHFT